MSKFPKFQVWDSVRVTHPGYWFDKVGTVTARDADGDRCYVVSFPDRAPANFTADELILADVVEDAKPVKHGADCPWCAPTTAELEKSPGVIDDSPEIAPTISDADKLRLIADTVAGQSPFGTELANFRKRLLAILSIGERS